jgi:hypothetical protein
MSFVVGIVTLVALARILGAASAAQVVLPLPLVLLALAVAFAACCLVNTGLVALLSLRYKS